MASLLRSEPVAIQAAIIAVVNLLIALGAIMLDTSQIGTLNIALAAVFGLIARALVTPNTSPSPSGHASGDSSTLSGGSP